MILTTKQLELIDRVTRRKGGPGSGNFGHEGRPGEVGGSGPGEVGGSGEGGGSSFFLVRDSVGSTSSKRTARLIKEASSKLPATHLKGIKSVS